MRHRSGKTVFLLRSIPGGVDQYGDPLPSTDLRLPIYGVAVAPRASDDIDSRSRAGVIVGFTLYMDYDEDIRFSDRFEIDGEVFEVEGEPGRWENPYTGSRVGQEVAVKRAEG